MKTFDEHYDDVVQEFLNYSVNDFVYEIAKMRVDLEQQEATIKQYLRFSKMLGGGHIPDGAPSGPTPIPSKAPPPQENVD